jgi:hypothetical protein
VRAPIGPARGEPEEGGSLVRQPWFWVGTAVVVAVIVVGALVVLRREPTDVPASDLGNYRF